MLAAWLDDARRQCDAAGDRASAEPSSLTVAELRILGYLPTHLSFREIAERTYVSANTVKTQANAVYRKLDVSCRSEAVARAREIGLIDALAGFGFGARLRPMLADAHEVGRVQPGLGQRVAARAARPRRAARSPTGARPRRRSALVPRGIVSAMYQTSSCSGCVMSSAAAAPAIAPTTAPSSPSAP